MYRPRLGNGLPHINAKAEHRAIASTVRYTEVYEQRFRGLF
jgi:hypothetical protein